MLANLFLLGQELLAQQKIEVDSLIKTSREILGATDLRINKDTLYILSENGDFDYPFGKFNSSEDIKEGQPRDAIIKNIIIYPYNGTPHKVFSEDPVTHRLIGKSTTIDTTDGELGYRMSYKKSWVVYSKDNSEDNMGYVMHAGKIVDQEIVLHSGIRVCASKVEFLHKYFNDVAIRPLDHIKVVEIESPRGTLYYYVFENEKLKIIYFKPLDQTTNP